MKTTVLLLTALLITSIVVTTSAHHSFAAEFDASKPITLEGRLTRVKWANPHGWIWVDAPDKSGAIVNWAIEFGSPIALLRRGLRVSDFPPGITVVVKGFLAKNGTATVNAASVTLPDGRNLFTASSNPNAQGTEP